MAQVVIAYGYEDQQAAEVLEGSLESYSNINAITTEGTQSINYSDFDGVIAVGGRNASQVYENLFNEFNWKVPDSEWDTLLQKTPFVINGVEYGSFTGVDIVDFKNGVPVVGISGYTADDTLDATKYFTGDKQSSETQMTSTAGVDDFVDAVREAAGENTDDPAEDPNDPILDDPEDNEPAPEMPVKLEVESTSIGIPDSEEYSITVNGYIQSEDVDGRTIVGNDTTVTATTGGGDRDTWNIAENTTITDVQAENDLYIYINGDRYKYLADRDKMEESGIPLFQDTGGENDHIADSEKTEESKEKEENRKDDENQSIWQEYLEALKNPLGSPENMVKVATVVIGSVISLQIVGAFNQILSILDR